MSHLKKTAVVHDGCVACGNCANHCPLGSITVLKGVVAVVDDRCVGCGRCAQVCPAEIITIEKKEEVSI